MIPAGHRPPGNAAPLFCPPRRIVFADTSMNDPARPPLRATPASAGSRRVRPSSARPSRSRRRPGRFRASFLFLLGVGLTTLASGCSSRRPPATGAPPAGTAPAAAPEEAADAPRTDGAAAARSSANSLTEDEILALPPEDEVDADLLDIASLSIEELNERGVLVDIHFGYDSAALSAEARETLERNAAWLSRYPGVRILIEGHCDERGTVEYNLALGEGRARAAQDYLARLGIAADRMQIISYGKEFPIDPGHDESAWRRNRRGHLEIVAR